MFSKWNVKFLPWLNRPVSENRRDFSPTELDNTGFLMGGIAKKHSCDCRWHTRFVSICCLLERISRMKHRRAILTCTCSQVAQVSTSINNIYSSCKWKRSPSYSTHGQRQRHGPRNRGKRPATFPPIFSGDRTQKPLLYISLDQMFKPSLNGF
jgi:hypothetical protein